jgi:hypothetical protein
MDGTVSDCIYLGNGITTTTTAATNAIIGGKQGGTVKNCYFTDATLNDEYAQLMPMVREDNTYFLDLLHTRDEYMLKGNSGLTEEQVGYDLAINGREFKAVQKADNTWSSRAFAVSQPFDMEIPEAMRDDVKVYSLHEIDVEKKELIFTNDYPIMKAGWAYLIVISKGSVTFSAKNTLVKEVPMEPEVVRTTDGSKELGYWCSTFKKLDNERLVEENGYIMQSNGTFRHIDKIYSTKPYISPFLSYFSALEPIGTSYKMKFVRIENGVEIGYVTDFPAEEFYSECDIDEATGIVDIPGFKVQVSGTDGATYNLNGQQVSDDYKGIVIKNGKKIIKN